MRQSELYSYIQKTKDQLDVSGADAKSDVENSLQNDESGDEKFQQSNVTHEFQRSECNRCEHFCHTQKMKYYESTPIPI